MRRQVIEGTLVVALLACVVLLGVALRLQDPLSTRALGAEDTYSHVVFTKEWQTQGYFADSYQMGTEMYPPGMHAWLAAFVPFTGMSLFDFARIVPPFFGGLAVLGMFALGHRLGGPAAGLGAAFLTAVMPEHIFRTELLFPTAFDLALLSVWMLGFHMAIHEDRSAGIVLFALATVPLAIMHPWVVPLFAVPLALYAALRAMRGPTARKTKLLALPGTTLERSRLWIGAALLVPATAFAMATRWDMSGTGFADFLSHLPKMSWIATTHIAVPLLLLILVAVLGVAAAVVVWLLQYLPSLPRLVGVVLGLAPLALLPRLLETLPKDVNYHNMLGPLAIGLALAGYVVCVIRPTALGDLGISVTLWLFPLTALDVFGSPFWPQRTAVYLCVGIALLGAAFLGQLHAFAIRFAHTDGARQVATVAVLLVVAGALTGSAVADPPHPYDWYRLYNDGDHAGFEQVAHILDEDAASRVFVYTWQPALLVKALTAPEHVWYGAQYFNDEAARAKSVADISGQAFVLVEKHTTRAADAGKADLGFLEDGRHHLVYTSPGGGLRLYEVDK